MYLKNCWVGVKQQSLTLYTYKTSRYDAPPSANVALIKSSVILYISTGLKGTNCKYIKKKRLQAHLTTKWRKSQKS